MSLSDVQWKPDAEELDLLSFVFNLDSEYLDDPDSQT